MVDPMVSVKPNRQSFLIGMTIAKHGNDMETYEILRGLREDRDLTQQELADLLKIGRTMYRRYETGETEIPVRHLKSLCLFYGISADYILELPNGLPYGFSKTK